MSQIGGKDGPDKGKGGANMNDDMTRRQTRYRRTGHAVADKVMSTCCSTCSKSARGSFVSSASGRRNIRPVIHSSTENRRSPKNGSQGCVREMMAHVQYHVHDPFIGVTSVVIDGSALRSRGGLV